MTLYRTVDIGSKANLKATQLQIFQNLDKLKCFTKLFLTWSDALEIHNNTFQKSVEYSGELTLLKIDSGFLLKPAEVFKGKASNVLIPYSRILCQL